MKPDFYTRRDSAHNSMYAMLGVLLFFVLWQIVAAAIVKKSWLLPAPTEMLLALWHNRSLLWSASKITLCEAVVGMLAAVVLALLIAMLLSLSRCVRKMVYPLLMISQMIPIIVLAPLFLIWFGYGLLPKILVVILTCFFPMVINALAGLTAVDAEKLAFYRLLGMNRRQLLLIVRLPAMLPFFFGGLRVAAAYSMMGAVIGEWLGAQSGLGVVLIRAQRSFDLPLCYAAVLAIILWSGFIFALVRLMEYFFLPHPVKDGKWTEAEM